MPVWRLTYPEMELSFPFIIYGSEGRQNSENSSSSKLTCRLVKKLSALPEHCISGGISWAPLFLPLVQENAVGS